jgi:dipeptidyl aminopeptidase/acylaminoacyl peptidase
MRVKAAIALVTMLTAACGIAAPATPVIDASPVPVQQVALDLKEGWLGGIVWLRTGEFAVDYDAHPMGPGAHAEVWQLQPDGRNFHPITLPAQPGCRRTLYHSMEALNDGQLGLSFICDAPDGVLPVASYGAALYDPRTGATQIPVAGETLLNPHSISWNPAIDRAIASDGSDLCGSLAWLTPRGAEAITMTIRHGSESWHVDTYFREQDRVSSYDCTKDGMEAAAHWSPDGRQIAFLGTPPDSSGRGATGPYPVRAVYVMDPLKLQPRPILDGLENTNLSAWSPDSNWLAITAQDLQGHGAGSWLFRPSSGKIYRIAGERLDVLSWSPDGRRLVALKNVLTPGTYPPQSTILIFDVRSVVSGG